MVADVAGAYLNADMKEMVLMKFEGNLVDFIVASNPKRYAPYVTYKTGRKVLYIQLLKAIYGCMKNALLWYQMFTECLQDIGFCLNPYDLCVVNKNIRGKQCTIAFYVDDLFGSHVEKEALEEVIAKLEE